MDFYLERGDRVMCLLCRHYCILGNNQSGMCNVEKNINGKIECLVYDHPSAVRTNPIERNSMYHFLPGTQSYSVGTVGCNLKCPYCEEWSLSQEENVNSDLMILPKDTVQSALEKGCESISYTYNEPVVWYPYAKHIGLEAKKRGLKNIFVTNGFASDEVCHDMPLWLDAANVDLNSFDPMYYRKTLKGDLEGVKESLRLMVGLGIWIEVTTLVVPGQNDKEHELKAIAQFIADELGTQVPWHINAFHPDYKMQDIPPTSLSILNQAYAWGKEAGLNYIYIGNVPTLARTDCPQCGTLLIERHNNEIIYYAMVEDKCPLCERTIEGVWK